MTTIIIKIIVKYFKEYTNIIFAHFKSFFMKKPLIAIISQITLRIVAIITNVVPSEIIKNGNGNKQMMYIVICRFVMSNQSTAGSIGMPASLYSSHLLMANERK